MSRALRLVVTQSKREHLEIPKSCLKIHGVYAVVVFTKQCGKLKMSMHKCPMNMPKSERVSESKFFWTQIGCKNRLWQNALQV